MAISIQTNFMSLNTQRHANNAQSSISTSLQRLSSGLRVNSAKDDAAGLAISDRMTSQVKGMTQASRNVNDGISMLQVAEGTMGEITNLIQRGRELAVQAANATNSASDRASLQSEVNQLMSEIDRIAEDTNFNGIKLFSGGDGKAMYVTNSDNSSVAGLSDKEQIVNNLKRSWLEQSEKIITEYFGIEADNVELEIILEDTIPGATAAYVSYLPDSNGQGTNLKLVVDMEEALNADGLRWPNDSLDQLIAHEMTHAVMAATTGIANFDKWFVEGTAEIIPGADGNLNNVYSGLDAAGKQAFVENIDNITTSWDVTAENYATAYASVRYLNDLIGGEGIKEVTQFLAADVTRDLDDYFAQAGLQADLNGDTNLQDITSKADFLTAFRGDGGAFDGNGVAFLNGLDLTNDDTGGIGGPDANGGTRDTTTSGTIPDIDNYTNDPLKGFVEIWPEYTETGSRRVLLETSGQFQMHVGADSNMTINAALKAFSTGDLGLDTVDLTTGGTEVIARFDEALFAIDFARSDIAAVMNRLESTYSQLQTSIENTMASRSRIMDADFASETAQLTRANILQQASTSMLSQANSSPQVVLSLLG